MHLITFYISSPTNHTSITIKHTITNAYIKITNVESEKVFYDTHQGTIQFLKNIFQTIDKTQYTNIKVIIPCMTIKNIDTSDPNYMDKINEILHIYNNMVSSNGEIFFGNRQYRD